MPKVLSDDPNWSDFDWTSSSKAHMKWKEKTLEKFY